MGVIGSIQTKEMEQKIMLNGTGKNLRNIFAEMSADAS